MTEGTYLFRFELRRTRDGMPSMAVRRATMAEADRMYEVAMLDPTVVSIRLYRDGRLVAYHPTRIVHA